MKSLHPLLWCHVTISFTKRDVMDSMHHFFWKSRCNGFNTSLFWKNSWNESVVHKSLNASLFLKKNREMKGDFSLFCSFLFLTVMFLLQECLASKENTHSCLEVYCWYCTHPSWCIASNAVLGLRPRTPLDGMHHSGSVHYQQYTSRHSCVFSLLAPHSCSNISIPALGRVMANTSPFIELGDLAISRIF